MRADRLRHRLWRRRRALHRRAVRPVDWPGPPARTLRARSRRRCEYSSWRRSSAGTDGDMAVGADGDGALRGEESVGRENAVAKIGFGCRAQARRSCRTGQGLPSRPAVMWVAWMAHQRDERSNLSSRYSTGRLPDQARQSSTSLVCSAMWMWMGAAVSRRSSSAITSVEEFRGHGAERMRRDAELAQRIVAAGRMKLLEDSDIAIGVVDETALARQPEAGRQSRHRHRASAAW